MQSKIDLIANELAKSRTLAGKPERADTALRAQASEMVEAEEVALKRIGDWSSLFKYCRQTISIPDYADLRKAFQSKDYWDWLSEQKKRDAWSDEKLDKWQEERRERSAEEVEEMWLTVWYNAALLNSDGLAAARSLGLDYSDRAPGSVIIWDEWIAKIEARWGYLGAEWHEAQRKARAGIVTKRLRGGLCFDF